SLRVEQEDSRPERNLFCPSRSRRVVGQQAFDEGLFIAETSQQSKIDVPRHSRLAPSLNRESANKTESPTLGLAEVLDLLRCGKEVNEDHRRSLAKWRCISTNPEDSPGG